MDSEVDTDILIVGGGLAGLSLARRLHAAGRDFHLFEARNRLGGRIDALTAGPGAVDLGPSWFWPGQPRMADLVQALGLTVFEQFAQGEISFEDETGRVHRGMGFASMAGSLRVAGGMARIIAGLAGALPADRLHLNAPACAVAQDGRVTTVEGRVWRARRVVLALPPRVAASLQFAPALSPAQMQALQGVPTWMAGQAKLVAVYARPFWREAGLSGDAMSRRGPLVEIHDACGPQGAPAALFGFLGVPASQRAGQGDAIVQAGLAQLSRIFGPEAQTPRVARLADWAFQPETATDADRVPPKGHPVYGLPSVLRGLWRDRLYFCATETAEEMGGYMEGALAASEGVAAHLGAA